MISIESAALSPLARHHFAIFHRRFFAADLQCACAPRHSAGQRATFHTHGLKMKRSFPWTWAFYPLSASLYSMVNASQRPLLCQPPVVDQILLPLPRSLVLRGCGI